MVQTCAFLSKYAHESFEVDAFTSDANLANRCKEMHVESSHILHSIYLCLLFGATGADLQERILADEEWERNLQIQLGKQNECRVTDSREIMPIAGDVREWINNGQPMLVIGRATKGCSILYKIGLRPHPKFESIANLPYDFRQPKHETFSQINELRWLSLFQLKPLTWPSFEPPLLLLVQPPPPPSAPTSNISFSAPLLLPSSASSSLVIH